MTKGQSVSIKHETYPTHLMKDKDWLRVVCTIAREWGKLTGQSRDLIPICLNQYNSQKKWRQNRSQRKIKMKHTAIQECAAQRTSGTWKFPTAYVGDWLFKQAVSCSGVNQRHVSVHAVWRLAMTCSLLPYGGTPCSEKRPQNLQNYF